MQFLLFICVCAQVSTAIKYKSRDYSDVEHNKQFYFASSWNQSKPNLNVHMNILRVQTVMIPIRIT